MVVFVHIAQPFSLPEWMTYIPRLGQLGCQIFFVLSSYTLCFSYERKQYTYWQFQKKRWLRIVPGYWSMIIIYLLLGVFSLCLFDENLFGTSMNWKHILVNAFLLNGITPGEANNLVVRGGWYIGTSVIFYFLFPLLYRIYNYTADKWRRVRIWLFPLVVTLGSTCAVMIASNIDSRFCCANNSFIYFSFVNQLPSFIIGFSLYDWKKNYIHNGNKLLSSIICLMMGGFTIALFYSGLKYAFVFVPAFFSAFFCLLFSLVSEKIENNPTKLCVIQKWGRYSFAVYLFHSLVVYEGSKTVIHICKALNNNVAETVVFVIWLPIAYLIIYYVGRVFSKYLSFWEQLVNNGRKRQHEHKI